MQFEDVIYIIILSRKEGCLGNPDPKQIRIIFNGVTGIVRPGEFVAMLGPSGSGKIIFLTVLGGRFPGKIIGSIIYNGYLFSGFIKRKIGFVI